MLRHNIINKITVIITRAPKSKMATRVGERREKCLCTLQPNIRIFYILQIYRFHYENNVRNIKINLMELCKC